MSKIMKNSKSNKIVKFPLTGKRKELENKMHNLQKVLAIKYNHIKEANINLARMHKDADKHQVIYNEAILDYAKRVGAKNVSLDFMQYSTKLTFNTESDGTIVMILDH